MSEGNAPVASGTVPPIATPILHTDYSTVFVPHGHYPGMAAELPLSQGLGLAWVPCAEVAGVLLVLWGGNPDDPTDEAIAVTLSRAGMRALIRDLTSIDQQMGDL